MEQKINVPIYVEVGVKTKRYYLNLNGYRNWHYRLSNEIKKKFKKDLQETISKLHKVNKPCKINFSIYYPNKRAFDIDNIGSIVTKFTNDSLVELGILKDDNYNYVTGLSYSFGGVDKDNPRCEVTITEEDSCG